MFFLIRKRSFFLCLTMLLCRKVQSACAELDEMWDVTDELMGKLEELTCLMYAAKSDVRNVKDLRYHLFIKRKVRYGVPNCHFVKTV